jgi:hypothetical protein
MRVLFYKRVCHTHTCVNTVRTLPLNIIVSIAVLPIMERRIRKDVRLT